MSSDTPAQSDHVEPRRRGPSREDWEWYKPVIRDRYLEPGMTLDKVVAEMKELYQFDATPKMYKDRLAAWGIRKNSPRAPLNADTPVSSSTNDEPQTSNAGSASGPS